MLPIEHIHPMIVHFPIVFGLSLAAFDLIARLRGNPIGGRGTMANISVSLALLAGISAMIAATFGDMSLGVALAKGGPVAALDFHDMLGSTTSTVLAVWAALRAAGWWFRVPLDGLRGAAVVAVELAFCALILATAFYGGQLVYEYGVAISHP